MFKNHINQYQRLIMISKQSVKINGKKNKKYIAKYMEMFYQISKFCILQDLF
jgi:hypothetical protein